MFRFAHFRHAGLASEIMKSPAKVLFLCTGNSCRSQMAEGWLRKLAPDGVVALSAGTNPQGINPRAIRAMAQVGIDISEQRSQSIDEFLVDPPDLVISVCDNAKESCPNFSGQVERLHWPFFDPAEARGNDAEVDAVFADVRDQIRSKIESWLREASFVQMEESN